MPNLINMSYKEVDNVFRLLNIEYTLEGSGYAYEQSIEEGNLIDTSVLVKLKPKY